ncbi:MAG TPA: signal peptidase I [Nocardioidaceae bacterium]|nr:signal peptidase I [Nocardioidaceae bacterium]
MRRFLGWTALLLMLFAILVPVAALTFSVQVQGQSMHPTLAQGDRLFVNFLGRDDIHRFDLVEASFDQTAARAVKRVIGLPGDEISVGFEQGDPVVRIRPADEDTTYAVDNPAWDDQPGSLEVACCDANGVAVGEVAVVTVPAGSYWLVGDNWGGSDDSRKFGFVRKDHIHARLNFRLLPLSDFGSVDNEVSLQEP